MSDALRDMGCTKCAGGTDLLVFAYRLGESPDITVRGLGGSFTRPGHDRGDPVVEYGCPECGSLYEHETFLLSDSQKRKYRWDTGAEGQPL